MLPGTDLNQSAPLSNRDYAKLSPLSSLHPLVQFRNWQTCLLLAFGASEDALFFAGGVSVPYVLGLSFGLFGCLVVKLLCVTLCGAQL